MQKKPSKKGGDVKKAPPGFYTAGGARKRLGVTQAIFRSMVAKGMLERVVPPGRSEGFYRATDVNRLANEQALFYLKHVSTSKYEPVEFSRATEDDIQGIFDAVASVWGAENITPVEVHRMLYRANPYIDYVVKFRGLVLGYINATPYIPGTLEAIMQGRKRDIDLTAQDVLQYESGKSYDVYIGIVVRQDIPGHEYYAKRLISGFFGALCDLASDGIIIRRMYAISDQERSIKMSRDLGFEEQSSQSGHFILGMETANTLFVRKYREAVQKSVQPSDKAASRRIAYDPRLEEALQILLENLTESNSIQMPQTFTVLLPLIDRLAESPQMTTTQQVLFRSIYEILLQEGHKEAS